MKAHKIFIGSLLLALVFTVSLLPGYMNENLIRLQEEVDLGKAGIVQLADNAFESAWLPRATKDRYLAELKAYAG